MKQLLLNQHTGVHLTYTPKVLARFIANHGKEEWNRNPIQVLQSIQHIFDRKNSHRDFIVLCLNEEDELVGTAVMVCNGRPKDANHMHLLTYFAVHKEQGSGATVQSLLKSAMRFASRQVKLSPSVPERLIESLPNWALTRLGNDTYAHRKVVRSV